MVAMEPLKEQVPERNHGAKEPVVETVGLESGQLAQGPARQQLEEKAQELSWCERGGFRNLRVFLDGI